MDGVPPDDISRYLPMWRYLVPSLLISKYVVHIDKSLNTTRKLYLRLSENDRASVMHRASNIRNVKKNILSATNNTQTMHSIRGESSLWMMYLSVAYTCSSYEYYNYIIIAIAAFSVKVILINLCLQQRSVEGWLPSLSDFVFPE